MFVSFFIGSRNRKKYLDETLSHIIAQNYKNYEIIVADSSNDGTEEMVKKKYPEVKFLHAPTNLTGIQARNLAAKSCKGEILISLDDDSFPGKNCISRVVEEFVNDEKLGLISFKIFNYDADVVNLDKLNASNDKSFFDNYLWSGCGGAIRKSVYEKYGYWEDWGIISPFELTSSAKIIKMGLKSKTFNDIFVIHHWAKPGNYISRFDMNSRIYTGTRYLLYTFKLDFFLILKLFKLFNLVIYDLLKTKNKKNFSNFIKASRDFLKYDQKKALQLDSKHYSKIPISFNFFGI